MIESLEFVLGKPRRGKTSYVVARIINEEMNYFSENYQNAVRYLKNISRRLNIPQTLPPQRHVVSSNIDIHRKYPSMTSYLMSGFDFGIPNKFQKTTKRLIPYGVYVFDEAYKYFSVSDEQKDLPPWVKQAFRCRGHIFLKIYLISHRLKDVSPFIRSTVDVFTLIEDSIHTFKIKSGKLNRTIKTHEFLSDGVLTQTEFIGRKFQDEEEIQAYLEGEKDLGEKFSYFFKGDIREFYDPYSFANEMEDYDRDFEYLEYISDDRPTEWATYKKQSAKKE